LGVQSPLAMSQYSVTAHAASEAQSPVQTTPLHVAGTQVSVPFA
jgi:hypothetical protein